MSQHPSSTFVVTDPIEIIRALVGLKDVRVLAYERWGPRVELLIEQVVHEARCPPCAVRARVKERPIVHNVPTRNWNGFSFRWSRPFVSVSETFLETWQALQRGVDAAYEAR